MTRTITALYDERHEAEAARTQLTATGIETSQVQITSNETDGGAQASSGGQSGGGHSGGGFFSQLKDFFMPDEDRHAYHEGVRRGGYLLTARVDESRADDVCRVLENSGAIDFDARQAEWRQSGWSGRSDLHAGSARGADGGETIPVVEEQLRVGKREVERGGVRVRSYVEETPVQEQVRLREEHVEVERHPVDRTLRGGDADQLFQERTIEMTERGEEAVIAKEAVVREEVGIRKQVDERTETISDSVRHTRVDVDDTRSTSGQGRQGLAGEPASFASRDSADDDTSLAMDGDDGTRINETDQERRERLQREGRSL